SYCTGISHPANGTRRAPSATWRSWSGVRCRVCIADGCYSGRPGSRVAEHPRPDGLNGAAPTRTPERLTGSSAGRLGESTLRAHGTALTAADLRKHRLPTHRLTRPCPSETFPQGRR